MTAAKRAKLGRERRNCRLGAVTTGLMGRRSASMRGRWRALRRPTSSQQQRLVEGALEVAVGALDAAVLMGDAAGCCAWGASGNARTTLGRVGTDLIS